MTGRVVIVVDDSHGGRDRHWTHAYALLRRAVETLGVRCLACGGRLWDHEGTGRIYCDDTCSRRHQRRRERYRSFLRELDASDPATGHKP